MLVWLFFCVKVYGEHKQNYDNHDGHGVKEEVYFPTLILLRNDSVLNPAHCIES